MRTAEFRARAWRFTVPQSVCRRNAIFRRTFPECDCPNLHDKTNGTRPLSVFPRLPQRNGDNERSPSARGIWGASLAEAAAALWEISPKETAYLTRAYEEIRSFRKQLGADQQEDAE